MEEVARIQYWVFEKHTAEFNNETDKALFVSILRGIKLHRSDCQNHIHTYPT